MRSLIICFVILLAGCNQGTNNVPYSDPALVAKVDALTKALADATHEQAQQAKSLSSLQLIGKVHGMVNAAGTPIPNFGPCTNMGVLIGRTGGFDAMMGNIESFQTCTGYNYSVDSNTGSIQPIKSIEWDGVNCTGNSYGLVPAQLATNGAVFVIASTGAVVMVPAGAQIVHPIISSDEDDEGNCQNLSSPGPTAEYLTQVNDTQVTGVPSSIPVPYTISSP